MKIWTIYGFCALLNKKVFISSQEYYSFNFWVTICLFKKSEIVKINEEVVMLLTVYNGILLYTTNFQKNV